ncbi:MAG TPA: hypothetical protein VMF90_26305 [Rhizobiaceae bacterium]|nr:hypothetical protein [Rhizobiaceae bacterium]
MSILDLLVAQLTDPFRIGLIIALSFTTLQTVSQTGRLIPLGLGVVFVAVMIPMTMGAAEADRTMAILVGLVSNLIVLAVVFGLYLLWKRVSGSAGAN